jgi:ABC-type branched-subunit amino acid transport system permease subunit
VHTGVLGLLIVILVMFLPKGLLSLSQRLARRANVS